MENVSSDRVKFRVACQLHVGDRRHSGVVLNLSPGGLFVQTNAKPGRGDHVELNFSVPGESDAMNLEASVVWKRVVPAQLTNVAHGGVGLRLLCPPERYFHFLADTARTHRPDVAPPASAAPRLASPSPTPAAESTPLPPRPLREAEAAVAKTRYRVRVSQGPRTRILHVAAETLGEARISALKRAGAGWKVVDAQPE